MKKLSSIFTAFLLFASLNIFAQTDAVDANGLAIGGYDVVSYFKDFKASKGDAKFATNYNNVTYYFTSQAHKDDFKAKPEQFLPQCNGVCAWGVAEKASKFPINPESFKVIDNKLYLFYDGAFQGQRLDTKELWIKDEKTFLQKLPAKWEEVKKAK
jgi:YHS domain-containing protein